MSDDRDLHQEYRIAHYRHHITVTKMMAIVRRKSEVDSVKKWQWWSRKAWVLLSLRSKLSIKAVLKIKTIKCHLLCQKLKSILTYFIWYQRYVYDFQKLRPICKVSTASLSLCAKSKWACGQIFYLLSIIAFDQGAVQYGLDPSIVHVRRAKCTYGIGVIRPFIQVPWQ